MLATRASAAAAISAASARAAAASSRADLASALSSSSCSSRSASCASASSRSRRKPSSRCANMDLTLSTSEDTYANIWSRSAISFRASAAASSAAFRFADTSSRAFSRRSMAASAPARSFLTWRSSSSSELHRETASRSASAAAFTAPPLASLLRLVSSFNDLMSSAWDSNMASLTRTLSCASSSCLRTPSISAMAASDCAFWSLTRSNAFVDARSAATALAVRFSQSLMRTCISPTSALAAAASASARSALRRSRAMSSMATLCCSHTSASSSAKTSASFLPSSAARATRVISSTSAVSRPLSSSDSLSAHLNSSSTAWTRVLTRVTST